MVALSIRARIGIRELGTDEAGGRPRGGACATVPPTGLGSGLRTGQQCPGFVAMGARTDPDLQSGRRAPVMHAAYPIACDPSTKVGSFWITWPVSPPRICSPSPGPTCRLITGGCWLKEDSWFSTAQAKLRAHANLLQELVLTKAAVAIDQAGQRESLSKVVELASSPDFVLACSPRPKAPVWDGILLSVGGNDLIQAAQTPTQIDGVEVPLHLRLLRNQTEWGRRPPVSAATSRSPAGPPTPST